MNIAEIVPRDDDILYIKTECGKAGLFDVKFYLESEAFAPLKDKVNLNEFTTADILSNGTAELTCQWIRSWHDGKHLQLKMPNKTVQLAGKKPPAADLFVKPEISRLELK